MTRTRSIRNRFLLRLEALEVRDVPSFLPPVIYAAGNAPADVAMADVNGDGRRDVVVANNGDDNVAVLLGNGDGTLKPGVYPTSLKPYGVAVADLNGDNRPDIVTANYYYSTTVLLNNGDGTFGPPIGYGTCGGSYKVAIGDVDGDHVSDVAVSDWNDEKLCVYHGNGDGTFALVKKYTMPHWTTWGIQIADLDGDGVGDITSDQPLTLTVIYSNGAVVSYPKDYTTGNHAVADVNRDGWRDVIIGGKLGGMEVRLNRGDGTLLPPVDVYMGGGAASPIVADLNRDRTPDIAGLRGFHDQVRVALGNGNGTFQQPSTYDAGEIALREAVGDLNNDRYPDLVVVGGQPNARVLLNDGLWTVPIPPPPGRELIPFEPVRSGVEQLDRRTKAIALDEADTAVKPITAPIRRTFYVTTLDVASSFAVIDKPFSL